MPGPRRAARSASGSETVEPRYRATGLCGPKERQYLARLARQAWAKCGAQGAGIAFDEWRHDQVAQVTEGRANGLREIRRGQYKELKAHFLALAGESARAFQVAQGAGQSPADRGLALAKLQQACRDGGLAYPEYPEAICRKQFRCGLEDLETGRIWFLFYTCTNRARSKAKQATGGDLRGGCGKSGAKTAKKDLNAQNPIGEPGERHV